ncbi:FecR family protein [Hydrotalea sp.]|uniref:FecR family protein n=1 Tax=Hydrotalea sp. TaxID=2881279 RepID=UPI00261F4676|nr:FecR family protein [Hydrotalea sp.]
MPDYFWEDNQKEGLSFKFRRKPTTKAQCDANWLSIQNRIAGKKQRPIYPMLKPILVAAGFFMLIVLTYFFVNQNFRSTEQYTIVQTGFGAMKRIVLPDSTEVMMNANSTLKIPSVWSDASQREVWIKGEAWFHVQKKIITKQNFIVHTPQTNVEVLGTVFNIKDRREKSVISLEEGSIQLITDKNRVLTKIVPGQVAIVTKDKKMSIATDNHVQFRSSWQFNQYHFEHTSLTEIAEMIQDNYGYHTVIDAKLISTKFLTGDLTAKNIQDFIKVISVAMNVRIEMSGNTIYIYPKQ